MKFLLNLSNSLSYFIFSGINPPKLAKNGKPRFLPPILITTILQHIYKAFDSWTDGLAARLLRTFGHRSIVLSKLAALSSRALDKSRRPFDRLLTQPRAYVFADGCHAWPINDETIAFFGSDVFSDLPWGPSRGFGLRFRYSTSY